MQFFRMEKHIRLVFGKIWSRQEFYICMENGISSLFPAGIVL
ncbi:hypothetical protein HMPREF3213_00944 [Heyndrickxia coagulans]|uniref:Uncharacterized protein n=1 Tax=Heyndrickxia coagulans TaxID=1398 RepID=A0A0C5C258_HEYCO|nr:hypothetical protein SB48_HM08orf02493 [Heyndrickxia coagulans]KWZ84155.1 hypothetical protein HMPREF3213_00944 [Heyndrickxia coagulans]